MMTFGRFVSLLASPIVKLSNWRWENRRCGNILCVHRRKQHFSFAGFCLAGRESGGKPCVCKMYDSSRRR